MLGVTSKCEVPCPRLSGGMHTQTISRHSDVSRSSPSSFFLRLSCRLCIWERTWRGRPGEKISPGWTTRRILKDFREGLLWMWRLPQGLSDAMGAVRGVIGVEGSRKEALKEERWPNLTNYIPPGWILEETIRCWLLRSRGAKGSMEALRESFLHLTFQMSTYKRATLDEEDLVDSTGDDIYPSSPMQVNRTRVSRTLRQQVHGNSSAADGHCRILSNVSEPLKSLYNWYWLVL